MFATLFFNNKLLSNYTLDNLTDKVKFSFEAYRLQFYHVEKDTN